MAKTKSKMAASTSNARKDNGKNVPNPVPPATDTLVGTRGEECQNANAQRGKDQAKGNNRKGAVSHDFPAPTPVDSPLTGELTRLERDCAALLKEIRCMEYSVESLSLLSGRSRVAAARAGTNCYELEELAQAEAVHEERLLESLENLYRITVQRQQMRDALNPQRAPAWSVRLLPFDNDIAIVALDGAIYVKTPPLFNRNKHWKSREIVDYYAFLSQIVAYKMREQESDLPRFFEKNLNLLAVYPRSIPIIPDADNLDTKTVTDAITNSLPGGDAGRYCTFSRASIHSDELPPGAYFSVTKGFAQVPDFWGNLSTLIQIFGSKQSVSS